MTTRNVLFGILVIVMLWTLVNIIHIAGGGGLTLAFGASGFGSTSPKPPESSASAATADASKVDASAAAASAPAPASGASAPAKPKNLPAFRFPRDVEMLTTLFALCGALGATLHALGSLVAFAGNGKFSDSWTLWYLAQPLRGAVLSAGFFWLIQGGLMGGLGSSDVPSNSMAMMGATFLVGLFSDPAIEKLREVFEVLFRTAGKPRANPLASGRTPTIAKVSFDNSNPPVVTIDGSGFDGTDEVLVNSIKLPVSRRTGQVLVVTLAAPLAPSGTALRIVVLPVQPNTDVSNVFDTKVP